MDDELTEFDRELRGLLSSLSQLLTDIASQNAAQNVNALGYWGQMDIEPFDVFVPLQDLQSQLERLQPRCGLLTAFDRDDPMPWLSQHDDAEFPGSSPAYEFLSALRSKPHGSLRAAVVEAASQCSAHLRVAAKRSDLHMVAEQWQDVLDEVVGSGLQISHRLDREMVAVTAQINRQPSNDDEPIDDRHLRQGGDVLLFDGPCGVHQWRKGNHVITESMQPAAWRMVSYLWQQPDKSAMYDKLRAPVYDDREAQADNNEFGSLRRGANRYFTEHGIPWQVIIKKRVVGLIERKL
jgi:hypothetical protein